MAMEGQCVCAGVRVRVDGSRAGSNGRKGETGPKGGVRREWVSEGVL